MARKLNSKLWQMRKRNAARLPTALRHVAIMKHYRPSVPGTFGAASDVVSIDPETGKPRDAAR